MNIKDKNLYFVGGFVRDEILNKPNFDIDLTYIGNAVEFAQSIKDAQIVRINEPFGTVRIKYQGEEIDIASTRSETYPKKGHLPVVDKIGCSLKEDILRRDFTINAMAKSTYTGEIIDYTSGLEDLKNKKIRVLHDDSFIDDPTRILRALKFATRFGFELDAHTQKLQDIYLENINYDMSYKRLKKELTETFNLNSRSAFEKFVEQKIYKLIAPQEFVLPDYDFSKLIDKYNPENVWIIYIGLLNDISSLPLTKIENKIVEEFRDLKNYVFTSDFSVYQKFKSVSLEAAIMYSVISPEISQKYLTDLRNIKLEITGNDLQKLGIAPNRKYQQCFDFVLERKISDPALDKEDEIQLAKDFFNIF